MDAFTQTAPTDRADAPPATASAVPEEQGSSSGPPNDGAVPAQEGGNTRVNNASSSAGEMSVIVMPTRVRVDSSVVCGHCSISWLSNCVLGITILSKVCWMEKKRIEIPLLESFFTSVSLFNL